MGLCEPDGDVVDDLVDLELVVGLGEGPEVLEDGQGQLVLLEEQLDDVAAPLDQLEVRLLRVEQDREHAVLGDPLDQVLGGEALVSEEAIVLNDLVEVLDALDPPFEEAGLETHEGDLEL